MRWQNNEQMAAIPMRTVGPVRIHSEEMNDEVFLPLATFEQPLWPSTHRGAKVCNAAGGIKVLVSDERMTRSVIVEAARVEQLWSVQREIKQKLDVLQSIVAEHSRFAKLLEINSEIVGSLLYLRFEFFTADASGHNMATLAAEKLLNWILANYPELNYVSISGNYCSDKKASAVNGILGRGKHVVAEVIIPELVCKKMLKTTAKRVVELNVKKNLIGGILAGSIRSANAHFANMLLAFYLATGQDAANIIEGSQGIVYAEDRDGALYFSVTLPNIIVGAIGNGKDLPFVQQNLQLLGCQETRVPGANARRLAAIAAACVLCGELSLLAAQTNPGELMRSHLKLERKHQ